MTDLLQLPVPAGLTDVEAARKLAEQGPNTIAAPEPPSTLWRVVAQLRDPMILLLLGAAVLTATLHDLTRQGAELREALLRQALASYLEP